MGNLLKKKIIKSVVVALVLSIGVAITANAEITRLSGADRYSTSDAIVKAGWSTGSETVILASGLDANTVDALTVAPLAKSKNAPVVLVNPKDSVANIVAKFKALNANTVYIANGTGVISPDVDAGLKGAGIAIVNRLGGANRYETALNIAKALGASNSIVIANGDNAHLVDSLSIAPIAAAKGMPIFLVGNSLDADTTSYINSLGVKTTYVLGGTGVVSDATVKSLPGVIRLAGAGRYETNAKVVDTFREDSALDLNNVFIASGEDANLIDALAGAPLAASKGAPIIFIHDNINPAVNTLLKSIVNGTTKITELGGIGAVTAVAHDVINEIQTGVNNPLEYVKNKNYTLEFPLGNRVGVYTGYVINNIPNGQGIFYSKNPEGINWTMDGIWINGCMNGQGTFTLADGEKYIGEFKDCSRDGQGTQTFTDGSKYIGEFKNDVMDGQGTFTWADGSVYYTGEWENNKPKN